MSNIMFWIATILLGIAALLLIWRMIQKQNEPKSTTIDYITLLLIGFIMFLVAYLAFTWLGEFSSGSQTGMLHYGASLFQAIIEKAAAEAKSPVVLPYK